MLITLPLPCPCMTRTSCFMLRITPRTFVANVGLDEGGFGTQAAQLGFESLALRFPAAGNDEAGTVLGKGQSGGATDACEGSRDQNDWPIHCATPGDPLMHLTRLITKACLWIAVLPWQPL